MTDHGNMITLITVMKILDNSQSNLVNLPQVRKYGDAKKGVKINVFEEVSPENISN